MIAHHDEAVERDVVEPKSSPQSPADESIESRRGLKEVPTLEGAARDLDERALRQETKTSSHPSRRDAINEGNLTECRDSGRGKMGSIGLLIQTDCEIAGPVLS